MRYFKVTCLAAAAALILMAAGASSASAKVCSNLGSGEACAGGHGKVYSGIWNAWGQGSVVLSSGFVNVTCTESVIEGEVTGSTGAGVITRLTFGGCTNNINGGACTASTTAAGTGVPKWSSQMTTGTAPNGTMTVTNTTWSFTCNILGANRSCYYTAADAGGKGEIVIIGGNPAQLKASLVPLAREINSDSLCSSTASFSATYSFSFPSSIRLT